MTHKHRCLHLCVDNSQERRQPLIIRMEALGKATNIFNIKTSNTELEGIPSSTPTFKPFSSITPLDGEK